MIERFQGDGHRLLIDSLKRQLLVNGNEDAAHALFESGNMVEFSQGEKIITENADDNDVYFIVAGTVSVVIKGIEVRTLTRGDHFGEMSAIEPSLIRSASVIATETIVAIKISSPNFNKLCDTFPTMWKPVAHELSRRLHDRNRLMETPNDRPKLFIISSVEALSIAREIQSGLQHDVLSTVWTDGVFWAGNYPLEDLENAVAESDFAVAVAQFEDFVESRGDRKPTLRDNVLFELGLFMGRLGRRRSFLVHPRLQGLKLPSDLAGLKPIAYIPPTRPEELTSALGPTCHEIRKIVGSLGVKTPTN